MFTFLTNHKPVIKVVRYGIIFLVLKFLSLQGNLPIADTPNSERAMDSRQNV